MPKTILNSGERDSLVRLETDNPHGLLGMHVLGGGRPKDVVARAFVPGARGVRVEPVLEKGKPTFSLTQVHDSGLFEGVGEAAGAVYSYDLVITYHDGTEHRTRDAYSFLPTLSEQDVFLFNEGKERRIFDSLAFSVITTSTRLRPAAS